MNGWSDVAVRLGLIVFSPSIYGPPRFVPGLDESGRYDYATGVRSPWIDWNPTKREGLPPVETTDSVAGSSCPVTLTHWKLRALRVLAELEVFGTITAKRIREIGIDSRRWTQFDWLQPGEKRGLWVRSEKCPPFDRQHPTAYAVALQNAKDGVL